MKVRVGRNWEHVGGCSIGNAFFLCYTFSQIMNVAPLTSAKSGEDPMDLLGEEMAKKRLHPW